MSKVNLEDCCEILDSKRVPITATNRKSGPYPYYGANGIQDYVADYIFDEELVLLAEDGGNFNSTTKPIAYRVSGKCWVNNHAHVLKPLPIIDVDYLCYSLMFYKVGNLVNGATREKLTQAAMRKMQVHLRPMPEQINIVSTLRKTQRIIAYRRTQLAKLDELVKCRFVELFGDPIRNEKNWETVPLKSVCQQILGGGTPSKEHPEYYTGNLPWVTPKDMKTLNISDSCDHITSEAVLNSSVKLIPPFSVLMVVRSGILKHSLPVAINQVEVTINQDMKAFIPNTVISSSFLLYYFKLIERDVLSGVRAVTADNIDFKAFVKRSIILPEKHLQDKFTDFVQRIDKLRFVIQKSLDETQTLFNSLMQQYFD